MFAVQSARVVVGFVMVPSSGVLHRGRDGGAFVLYSL